ncbi:unnamed protein product [Rhizoctonia solani]|uniref:Uncharacterized protein n=3 Tax=Rhizoctonia solani TaxID=456999 RepID=A0A8H2XIF2_9AGAM|nr:hypothetical protein RSOL_499830 [Rhizoctonia solani AG-3 Rhs1AP]KEP55541.1 hypothetical protein V565_003050 [Rhizoctonia solani 123E]CAE6427495.1 unnamed protein product [Rhizoctonia solani]CAE6525609.1 unnamed protein product [Rhizoctonia solani]
MGTVVPDGLRPTTNYSTSNNFSMLTRIVPTVRIGTRAFSTTLRNQKTVTETVKDTAQDVNLKVGKGLAAGIEGAEGATQKAKEALGTGQKKAEKAAEVGKQKANQTGAQARGKAEELKDKAKDL